MHGTHYVESAISFFVKVIVNRKNIAMDSSLQPRDLLVKFCVIAFVSEFENLRDGDVQRGQVWQAYLCDKSLGMVTNRLLFAAEKYAFFFFSFFAVRKIKRAFEQKK